MSNLMNRVAASSGTFTYDHGLPDVVSWRNPETGLLEQRAVMASPEELHEREVDAMRRALEGVEHRLAHVGEVFSWEEPLSTEKVERKRAELENERAFCLSELERLGAIEKTKGRRR